MKLYKIGQKVSMTFLPFKDIKGVIVDVQYITDENYAYSIRLDDHPIPLLFDQADFIVIGNADDCVCDSLHLFHFGCTCGAFRAEMNNKKKVDDNEQLDDSKSDENSLNIDDKKWNWIYYDYIV